MGLRVYGLGFRIQGFRAFGFKGFTFRASDLGF